MLLTIFLVFATLGITWFIWQARTEKRSLWLGIAFLAAFGTCLILVTFLLISVSDIQPVRFFLMGGGILLVIIIALFPIILVVTLLTSAVRLIKREGASLSNMLSLGLGMAYILYLMIWPMLEDISQSVFFNFLYTYLSFCFIFTLFIFILYTITNMLNLVMNVRKKYSYIIVLGSGLKNGEEVTPLLASRVDKGIELYRKNEGSFLVLSGGQGTDEKVAESVAMKNYALKQGVPESALLIEDKSVNTRENLLFSKQLIDDHKKENSENLLVVTTSYHVLRALLLAKNLGIACDGQGSRTKFYFSINAFVREWIAYLVLWRKQYITVLVSGFVVIAFGYWFMSYFVTG
ncbi:YdcF family protein [Amphibacillus sp. Q70]|uniref:YdcF family protein n=1 Tax=Amphibacillus sp. Q70 TaxID=3453416 RepID=UPI003F873E04